MLSVEAARARILAALSPLAAETIPVADSLGRVLAEDLTARVTQPPAAVSAMDGYAVRGSDVATAPVTLRQIGAVPAGGDFAAPISAGECVRIFTGAPLPAGADTIVIQENVTAVGDAITINEVTPSARYVRPAGLDFRVGDIGIVAGDLITVRKLGLAAAMNRPWLRVTRRPRVAILATGDEIVMPGDPVGPSQIVSSNGLALAAFVRAWGGEPIQLGIAPDRTEALQAMASGARGADLLVTTGGASVGEHDLVRSALGATGLDLDFWQIAMRPGKPLLFGRIDATPLLGLPGNPVSSLVCSLIFLRPALLRMLGMRDLSEHRLPAIAGCDLPANDTRQDYLRASLSRGANRELIATPFAKQDSSMLSLLARADALVIRPPDAPALRAGDGVEILSLADSLIAV